MVGSGYSWDAPLHLHLSVQSSSKTQLFRLVLQSGLWWVLVTPHSISGGSVQSSSKTQLYRQVLQSGLWWVLVTAGTPHSISISVYSPHLRPSYLGRYYSLAHGGF